MNVDYLIDRLERKQTKSLNKNGLHIEQQINLNSHQWNVSSLEFSPNGLYLASASWDKTAHIWDLRTLEKPLKLENGHSEALTCVAWLPQLEFLLATSSSDKSIIVWNSDTGDIMSRLTEHTSWVLDISFEESGQFLASASWDKTTIIWDMNILTPVERLRGHSQGVHSCQFNGGSNFLLCTTSEDTSIRLWDKRTDNRWHSDILLSGIHTGGVKCSTWSPCSNYIAAGSRDSKISVWDLRAVKVINCLYGHKSDVKKLAFVPTSSSLLFSVGDTSCCLWNAFSPKGESLLTLQQHAWSYEVDSICLSPDATLLATGGVDKSVCLSSVEVSEKLINDLNADVNNLPYAKIPAITQTIPQSDIQGGSSAKFVDSAVDRFEEREKEMNKKIAKQTIRINVPATSEVLQNKLTNLRNVKDDSSKSKELLENEIKMRRNKKPSTLTKTSRDIVIERKKNAPPPVKLKPSVINMSTNKSSESVMNELSSRLRMVSNGNSNLDDSYDSADDVFVTPRGTAKSPKRRPSKGVFSI